MTEHYYSVSKERVAIHHPPKQRGTFYYHRYYSSQLERKSSMLLTEGCLALLERTQCHHVFHEMIQHLYSQPTLCRYLEELKAAFWTVGLGRHNRMTLTCKSRANVKILSETFSCPDVDNDLFIPGVSIWTIALCSKDDKTKNDWLTLLSREY